MSKGGFYELEGLDQEGWPHWRAANPLPQLSLKEQERLLKMYVMDYFEDEQVL